MYQLTELAEKISGVEDDKVNRDLAPAKRVVVVVDWDGWVCAQTNSALIISAGCLAAFGTPLLQQQQQQRKQSIHLSISQHHDVESNR